LRSNLPPGGEGEGCFAREGERLPEIRKGSFLVGWNNQNPFLLRKGKEKNTLKKDVFKIISFTSKSCFIFALSKRFHFIKRKLYKKVFQKIYFLNHVIQT
jgi:hypothetical protein